MISTTKGEEPIFNSDQGSQFTSKAFTDVLIQNDIAISMDGRGRALDNILVERLWRSVKYENVYLKKYSTMQQLLLGLTDYFQFYNQQRFHQSLGYATPNHVYASASGVGARIVDKFGGEKKAPTIDSEKLGQRHSAAIEKALS